MRKRSILIFFLVLFGILGFIFLVLKFSEKRFAPGVKVAFVDLSFFPFEKGENLIKTKFEKFKKEKISFFYQKKKSQISFEKLKLDCEIKKTLKKAYKVGKTGNIIEKFKQTWQCLQGGCIFPLECKISEEELDKFITQEFGNFEIFPQNAEVFLNPYTLKISIKKEKEGKLFKREKIKKALEKEAGFLQKTDVFLVLEKEEPLIKEESAKKAKKEAEEILKNAPYLVFAKNKVFYLSSKKVAQFLNFLSAGKEIKVVLDDDSLKRYLFEIKRYVDLPPKNPVLTFYQGEIKIISPSKEGEIIEIEKNLEILKEGILKKRKKIFLVFKKQPPRIKEKDIKNLKIETLLGKGTSNFFGSPKNRIHNIKLASSILNGILIGPGEIFSFNKTLGPTTPERGFLPELVIKKNETVPEYGGGVCQVSTTLFRAAVFAGLEIIERHPHSFPVRYYNPQGFDATVYWPGVDLKFKNNTGGWILVQSKIKGYNLTFEIYGKKINRKVIVKGPYQYNIKPDGSMKAKLYQEVYDNGKLILKKVFYSNYKSPKLFPVRR